eukprot:TRINITY_DN9126_c0_g1_i1.p1 TRINITY_DN9126_c0_g1~~TRINITY_DN9126_c0_g1_i1.p1  ORF type:complete len:902 (-),score=75.20 TRINITY_DN9126_c0_g1_i1:288-2732(-)
MPERDLIRHAGLDSVVFLHSLKLGVKIFVPIAAIAALVLFPVNYTGGALNKQEQYYNQQKAAGKNVTHLSFSELDKLSIANIPNGSPRLWAHLVCAWVFSLWALWVLRDAFKQVARMRMDYLADQRRAPHQFTVLVRQVPSDPIKSVAETVDHFFSVVHSDHYLLTQPVYDANKLSELEEKRQFLENKLTENEIKLERKPDKAPTHKTGFLGLLGERVESIPFYKEEVEKIKKEIGKARDEVVSDPKSIMPAAFVSFRTRWGAAVAAQTMQSKNNTQWLTQWAPEEGDVKWSNLPVPYVSLMLRRALAGVLVIAIIFGYTFPVAFVQSLANIDTLSQWFPFLEPILNVPFINALVKSVLSGIALKIFLAILPALLTFISTAEGYTSKSQIDLAAAGKFFYFIVVTVFFSNILGGVLISSVKYLSENPSEIPTVLGDRIPTKAAFFMTYTMLDGWTGMAMEVFQLVPLILFHIKNNLLVRTPADRIKVMNPSPMMLIDTLFQVELYFLLPFIYCVTNPLYLPFAIIFFVLAFIGYRNQILNVYNAEYQTAGFFWPHFHLRLMAFMLIQQVTLIGIFVLKSADLQFWFLLPLPFVSIAWHVIAIHGPYNSVFFKYALEEANRKDTIDRTVNPDVNPRSFLARAYLHPSLQSAYSLLEEDQEEAAMGKATGDGDKDGGGPTSSATGGTAGGDDADDDASTKVPLCNTGTSNTSASPRLAATGREAEVNMVRLVPVKRHPRSAHASPSLGPMGSIPEPGTPPAQRRSTEATFLTEGGEEEAAEFPSDLTPVKASAAGGRVLPESPATVGTQPLLEGRR